jgi:glycosyltransferase involved in cell wall biosynthesis
LFVTTVMSMKLQIVVSTWNRREITELSLRQTSRFKADADLIVYDDYSTEYDLDWLRRIAGDVRQAPRKLGIAALRAYQFREFLRSDAELVYFTDNDVLHDPTFVFRLRRMYDLIPAVKLPVCLYNSSFHSAPENSLKETREVEIRKTAPGISQLYDRSMAERIVAGLVEKPGLEGLYGWDYHLPMILQLPWIQTRTSYLEHFGAGGMHNSAGDEGLERDRALNPTPYLVHARESVVRWLAAAGPLPELDI